jgi:hypothetical protein
VQGTNQGRVFVRPDGKTNGPWLDLILTDIRGREVARRNGFITPVWECGLLNSRVYPPSSATITMVMARADFDRLAGARLEDTGGEWREEQCR